MPCGDYDPMPSRQEERWLPNTTAPKTFQRRTKLPNVHPALNFLKEKRAKEGKDKNKPYRDCGLGEMEQKFLLLERHIRWLENKLNVTIAQTHNLSLTQKNLDYLTDALCSTLQVMSEEQKDSTIYNGRDPYARMVADWWDQHQELDRLRLSHEAEEERQNQLIESARAKLTEDEFWAIVNARL